MCPDNIIYVMRLTDQQRDREPGSSFRRRPESRPCHFPLDSGLRRSDGLDEENECNLSCSSASCLAPRPSPLPAGHGRQGGFSLPIAIFIIVIMALIGTAMVTLSETGQRSVASEVQSIRTFYAAETGAQLAIAQLLPLDGSAPGCPAISNPPASADLNDCAVALSCTTLTHAGQDYYRVTSDATCDFAGQHTRRQIEVMVRAP